MKLDLGMLTQILRCPVSQSHLNWLPIDNNNGLLVAEDQTHWYPIVDSIPEVLVPDLWSKEARSFVQNRIDIIKDLNLPSISESQSESYLAQQQQRAHFDHYSSRTDHNYQDYQQSLFWQTVDNYLFDIWVNKVAHDALVLDLGCADGRSTFRWTNGQRRVIGLDISRRMVERARQRALRAGLDDLVAFIVADADRLPFAVETFDAICIYGVLHHVPNPKQTLRQAYQLLRKENGQLFALENNFSAFRFAFDILMRIWPLWSELAGSEPLISRKQIASWLVDLPVVYKCFTLVFLPPHLFNWIGNRTARNLFKASELISRQIPWWRHQGGLIALELRRL